MRKFDSEGQLLWTEQYDTTQSGNPGLQLALAPDGELVVALSADGEMDFGGGMVSGGGAEDLFIVKYSKSGEHLWSKAYGDAASQHDPFVALAPDGTDAVTCSMNGKIDVGSGAVLSKGEDVAVVKLGR